MKKIFVLVFVLSSMVFLSCSNSENKKGGDAAKEIKIGVVNQLSTDMFKKLVYDYPKNPNEWVYVGKQPCIIDFYADWCRPCKMVAPIMEELAAEYKGKVVFYKINTDEEKELAQAFNIQSIPAILYVPVTGKPQMAVGLSGKEAYIQQIQTLLLNGQQ